MIQAHIYSCLVNSNPFCSTILKSLLNFSRCSSSNPTRPPIHQLPLFINPVGGGGGRKHIRLVLGGSKSLSSADHMSGIHPLNSFAFGHTSIHSLHMFSSCPSVILRISRAIAAAKTACELNPPSSFLRLKSGPSPQPGLKRSRFSLVRRRALGVKASTSAGLAVLVCPFGFGPLISSVEMMPRPAGGRYAGISFGNSMPCLRAQRVKRACLPVVAGVGAVLRSVICLFVNLLPAAGTVLHCSWVAKWWWWWNGSKGCLYCHG